MEKHILEYLTGQRIGVLAVSMLDTSLHGATVHFAYNEASGNFLFRTHRSYRKCEPLFGRPLSQASFVIGVSEEDMKSFQADGEVRLLNPVEREQFDAVYLGKFPEKNSGAPDPEAVAFTFIPKWWRFTDWTTSEGKKTWTSDSSYRGETA